MITERAMLAAVHISIWTAVKHDRKISRDVADQHGAHQGAGRYNKQLLRGADKLDELRTLAGNVRQYFYKITLPWSDEGFRLLPSNLYFDLTARMPRRSSQRSIACCATAKPARRRRTKRLQRPKTSWLICLRTWRRPRRHETRDTSIAAHSEGAHHASVGSSVLRLSAISAERQREPVDSNHGDRWSVALLQPRVRRYAEFGYVGRGVGPRGHAPRAPAPYAAFQTRS